MALSYVYSYDPISKKYMGKSLEGFASPLEPGVILVPANATLIEPPRVESNEYLVWSDTDNKWDVREKINQPVDMNEIRRIRNDLLRSTDFTMLPDSPVENRKEWIRYRQELRDLPDMCTDNTVVWPIYPTTMKQSDGKQS